MQKLKLLAALVLLCSSSAGAAEDYWQQFVHYTMNVTLDPETHMLTGTSSILYRNNSPDTLTKIYMHLYPNGYRDTNSLRAREAKQFYRKLNTDPDAAGWINITEFRILPRQAQEDSTAPMQAFHVDDTILEANLPEPLPPGGEMRIQLAFEEKVRRHSGRAGYRGKQYDFAQWYPKLCVYDENGWNNVPFHLTGEFYGEFGTFDVTMDVPFDYIVGATGAVAEGDPGWSLVQVDTSLDAEAWQEHAKATKDSIKALKEETPRRQVTFHAENVHDFAWLACPDFLYEKGEWDGIPIHVLYRSRVKSSWSQVVAERGARALEWLSTKFGRYPYPQLTITHGLLGGGMEYPMLVMNSSESESLILHEVGHIYFYGMLANNESKEAWLDEGFTSFQTAWYMESRYGKWGYDREKDLQDANWLDRHRPPLTRRQGNRNWAMMYMNSGHNEPISRWAYEYKDALGYSVNAYTKGRIFYEMLRYVVGEEAFDKICQEYFRRWHFKHVNEQRFKAVCEEVSGMDLDWFFDEWLHGTPTVNYKLGKIKKSKQADGSYRTEVQVKRGADGIMPVQVQITLPGDSTVSKRWDGKATEGSVVFETAEKPGKVKLDPNDEILDTDRLGNGTVRLEVHPQYPRWNYNPPDAYVLTYKPFAWYNDVDGLRLMLSARGSYRMTRNLRAELAFGAISKKFDGSLRYEPKMPFGDGFKYALQGGRIEGRIFAGASLSYNWGKLLFQPPRHRLELRYDYTRLDDANYAFTRFDIAGNTRDIRNWSPGEAGFLTLKYSVNPRGFKWRSNVSVEALYGDANLGGDSQFTRLATEIRYWIPGRSSSLYVRAYAAGFVSEKIDLPIQHLIPAFSADYYTQFRKHRLSRSKGAFFPGAHYQPPGGGNMRGYYDRPEFLSDALAALNIEWRRRFRWPLIDRKLIRPILGRTDLVFFGDVGTISLPNASDKTLADAGIGFVFEKRLPDAWYTLLTGTNFTLRFDMPFWVSEPYEDAAAGIKHNPLRFRYVIGFQRAL